MSETVQNSVSSVFLKGMTDEQIREKIDARRGDLLARAIKRMPGVKPHEDGFGNVAEALEAGRLNFTVKTEKIKGEHSGIDCPNHVRQYRDDTLGTLGVTGKTYGVLQYPDAFESLDILVRRGDAAIVNVQSIDDGARARVVALIGVSEFGSQNGAPNTLGHFAIFEASHDMSISVVATLYTMRLECFNGMTSREQTGIWKQKHTKRSGDRLEKLTREVLSHLIGQAEAESEMFANLARKSMNQHEFADFAVELLGGPLEEDASKSKVTRRENDLEELFGYFVGGNQGAGATAWGAYNSVTRWIEAKREGIEDAARNARKFSSNLQGSGQRKVAQALRLLTR